MTTLVFKPGRFMLAKELILFGLYILSLVHGTSACCSQLRSLTSCNCPGYVTSYECQICGDGFTKWQGSAINCNLTLNENPITLRHDRFAGSGTSRKCNSGNIVGRSLNETNGCYTSLLEVNVIMEMNGQTVSCIHDNGRSSSVIGSIVISVTTDPPPVHVHLADINSTNAIFKWNPMLGSINYTSLQYNIESNCGKCPKTAYQTNVSCTLNELPSKGTCSFRVRSVVYDNITGSWSSPIYATLKVPGAPNITSVVAKYGSDDKKKLINLDVKWTELEPFRIFRGFSGLPTRYTANFTIDKNYCGSSDISAVHCDGVCITSLPSSCYLTQDGGSMITISVSATNRLGEGPHRKTDVGNTNIHVRVTFESARRAVCSFHEPLLRLNETSCNIRYGPCQQRLTMTADGSNASGSPPTVVIDINTDLKTYCYSITASSSVYIWSMEGSYGRSGSDIDVIGPGTIASIAINIFLFLAIIAAFSNEIYICISYYINKCIYLFISYYINK